MNKKVICPECQAEGEKSTVRPYPAATTCMAYSRWYDEEGNYHSHDPNKHGEYYQCSRGHKFGEWYYLPCPTCGTWIE